MVDRILVYACIALAALALFSACDNGGGAPEDPWIYCLLTGICNPPPYGYDCVLGVSQYNQCTLR